MTTFQMWLAMFVAADAVVLAVLAWMKVTGRLPEVDIYVLRLRIRQAERRCRRGKSRCEVCSNSFVRDFFPEDVRRDQP